MNAVNKQNSYTLQNVNKLHNGIFQSGASGALCISFIEAQDTLSLLCLAFFCMCAISLIDPVKTRQYTSLPLENQSKKMSARPILITQTGLQLCTINYDGDDFSGDLVVSVVSLIVSLVSTKTMQKRIQNEVFVVPKTIEVKLKRAASFSITLRRNGSTREKTIFFHTASISRLQGRKAAVFCFLFSALTFASRSHFPFKSRHAYLSKNIQGFRPFLQIWTHCPMTNPVLN